MKAQILTEDQIPEALSIARGVFDYCLRARITDLEMIHIFLQYTENTNIRHMIAEGTLTMWGIFEQGHMIAMSGMQKEGHITMLYVLPVFQRRGCGRCLLEEMKAYAANQYQLQRVTLSAMPAWTADYFTKRRFHPMEVTQPCSFVPWRRLCRRSFRHRLRPQRPGLQNRSSSILGKSKYKRCHVSVYAKNRGFELTIVI